jgi:uncharacterized SAM-binding protein YcdF (DUF218 family)
MSVPFTFIAKKIVTSALLPPGLFIVLLLLSAMFVKRLRLWSIIFACIIYVSSIEPMAELLLRPLEDAFQPSSMEEIKKCDAYVVLGAGVRDNVPDINGTGALNTHALPRVITAYRLYQINKRPIILSGGRIFKRATEADIAATLLMSLGVPKRHIFKEDKSIDTAENAEYVKTIADKLKVRKIVLITSASHMRRSHLLFSNYFREIAPYPTDYQTSRNSYDLLSYLPDTQSLESVSMAVKEYLGVCWYYWGSHRLLGLTSPPPPAGPRPTSWVPRPPLLAPFGS